MRKHIESLMKGILLCTLISLFFASSVYAQNFKIKKFLEGKKLIPQGRLAGERDVDLTLNEGYDSEEFPHNCAGGFDFLPNGDVIAIEYDWMYLPDIFIFDANGDGIPATPQIIGSLVSGYYGSFIKVSPDGDYALFGSTAMQGDPHYIEKIDLSDYSITQVVQLQGNFDLAFIDNEQVLISANADWNPATPNCIHYLDINHPDEMRVIASIDDTPSGPLELNDAGDLYYMKSTNIYPAPPDSHHLFKFTAPQIYGAVNQGVVLSEGDSQIDIIFDTGYGIAINSFNDLFVSDLMGHICKVNEGDGTKSEFCTTVEGGFSHMAFYKSRNFFNPYQNSPSKLAVAFSDLYYATHALIALSPESDDSFADEVLDFSPGLGGEGDTQNILGTPVGGGTYAPGGTIISLGDRDNPDSNSPATVDLRFHYPILDDTQNLYGLDLIVFGNAFWAENDPHNRFTEPALIEISKDLNHNGIADDEWFLILPNILPADLGPLDPVEYYTMTLRNYGEYSPVLMLGDINGDNIVEIPDMNPEDFYTVPDRLCYEGDEPSYLVDAYSGGGDASDLREAVVQSSPGVPLVDAFGHMHYVYLDKVDFVRLRDARNGDFHNPNPPLGMVTSEIDAVSDAEKNLRGLTISVNTVAELETALNTAVQGDEIVLEPGIYQVDSTLVMPLGVSIKGNEGLWTVNYGDDDVVIDGDNLIAGVPVISLIDTTGNYSYEQGYEISGIHFNNCSVAIYVEDMYPAIQNNVFEDTLQALSLINCQDERIVIRNNIFGHKVSSSAEVGIEADNTNLAVTHNDFVNFTEQAVLLRNACEVYLRDNIFAGNEIGLSEEDPGYIYGHYNVFYNNTVNYNFSVGTIENNILEDPSFALAAQGDYRLTVDSPVRAQGMGGADPGVYDGTNFYPFDIAMGYYLNLNKFPWYQSIAPEQQYSGAAVAKMWLSYLWWDNTVYEEPPEYPETQQWLYDYGHSENYDCNTGLQRLDTQGLWHTIQTLDPAWDPYHYNFGIHNEDTVEEGLDVICHWIAYPAGGGSANPNGFGVDGYPVHVPAAVTTGGNYDNWMAIRGIRTSENPWETDDYGIFGFWVNDPSSSGIGANRYSTINQWTENYYFNLTNINVDDPGYNKWVSILEPPEHQAEVKLITSKARFKKTIKPVLMEKVVLVNGIDEMVLVEQIEDKESLDIVQTAIDGVSEELIPYDLEFTKIFANAVAAEPLLVKNEGDNYYLVPFNIPIDESESMLSAIQHAALQKRKKPIEIQKFEKGNLQLIKLVNEKVVTESVYVDPREVDKNRTLVVIIVDAQDGSFKEASWIANPMEYLPISLEEALKIVSDNIEGLSNKMGENDKYRKLYERQKSSINEAIIELIYIDSNPYYPSWKVTIGSEIYIINQQGELSIL